MTDTITHNPWLVWMWQHYSLCLYDFPTQDEAVSFAVATGDNGDGALQCIEGPDGVLARDVIDQAEKEIHDAERARWRSEPKNTHRVDVKAPNGKDSAGLSWHSSKEEAEAAYVEAIRRFGADRVSLHEFR